MDLTYRPIVEEELPEFRTVLSNAFHGDPREDELEDWKAWFELDRSLAAFDEGRIVATAGVISFELTVPGRSVAAGGVTVVSVRATHRRRGILSTMMHRQLSEIRERGEPMAILWASESVIYGRFGYGMAVSNTTLEIERRRAGIVTDIAPRGEVHLLGTDEAAKVLPDIYDRFRVTRAGFLDRPPVDWEHLFRDVEHRREGWSANRYATYYEDSEPLGYTRYRAKGDWEGGFPRGSISGVELIAPTAEAYVALWSHLLEMDLVETIEMHHRPIREPLPMLLADRRRLRARIVDGLWLRILDVPASLSARRYRAEDTLVLEVSDPLGHGAGRFRLEGGPEGASCVAGDADPDITLDVAALGAVYMGETSFTDLAQARRASGDHDALRRADLMFGWDPPAWVPFVF